MKTKYNYQDYIIAGILYSKVKNILYAKDLKRFNKFMEGQTTLVIGKEALIFVDDFERFLRDLPNND